MAVLKNISRRFWILGALLLILCALGLVQYHWINQLAEAHRQSAQVSLARGLSDLESDFDIEITRAFIAFQAPFVTAHYSERYQEWLRHAPYPNLIRGVYIAEQKRTGLVPEPVILGEPVIPSTAWRQDLPNLSSSRPPNPTVVIDGNPTFLVPAMEAPPEAPAHVVPRNLEPNSTFQRDRFGIFESRTNPSRWVVVVLDTEYIKNTFLPGLVRKYFPSASKSDYDVLVLDVNSSAPQRVIFESESAHSESEFAHSDAGTKLFELRPDCFAPRSFVNAARATGPTSDDKLSRDILSEILAQRPTACRPGPASADSSNGLWKILIRYRAGSLEQAIATFRYRNLFISGSVLLVLVLGICMLVVLTERARALAEMQTEFVLSVSHELRTPLTVIRLAADNLTKGLVEESERVHKYGKIIHSHASELSNMVEQTLAFGRLQSATVVPHRALTAPQQIAKDALAGSEPALRDAGIEVELDVTPGLPLVSVDPRLVERCLENLIQNAIKYAPAGRRIAIRVTKVDRYEGERVQMSVEDRGPGIAPTDLPHVFEPFYRGKAAEGSRVRGVGLGLALVKRIVEDHGGTVAVENSKSGGAIFSIFLPLDVSQWETHAVASS